MLAICRVSVILKYKIKGEEHGFGFAGLREVVCGSPGTLNPSCPGMLFEVILVTEMGVCDSDGFELLRRIQKNDTQS